MTEKQEPSLIQNIGAELKNRSIIETFGAPLATICSVANVVVDRVRQAVEVWEDQSDSEEIDKAASANLLICVRNSALKFKQYAEQLEEYSNRLNVASGLNVPFNGAQENDIKGIIRTNLESAAAFATQLYSFAAAITHPLGEKILNPGE